MTQEQNKKIEGMLDSIKEYESIEFKLNDRGNLTWIRKTTNKGEINLQKDKEDV